MTFDPLFAWGFLAVVLVLSSILLCLIGRSLKPSARSCSCAVVDAPQSIPSLLDADVLVVGGGPVGITMACLLGAKGIRTIVIERDDEICTFPRSVSCGY
jgi:hypothetical protein